MKRRISVSKLSKIDSALKVYTDMREETQKRRKILDEIENNYFKAYLDECNEISGRTKDQRGFLSNLTNGRFFTKE